MFNNTAIDVVIGLVFIYLLYSLLATVLAEMIATTIGLRARNLREAIDRMLNDEKDCSSAPWLRRTWEGLCRLWNSLRLMRRPKNEIVKKFYNHPEIKYLGSSGLFNNPSSFKAVSFSKTLLYLLEVNGTVAKDELDRKIRDAANSVFDKDTADYIISMWQDCENDLVKFKLQLEAWFDRTMEQASEWYKRKIQVVLLLLGLMLAWIFNADTILIVRKLSYDKETRMELVKMASGYLENNPERPKEIAAILNVKDTTAYKAKIDSLISVKKQLEADIASAHTLLGYGSWLPDSIAVKTDTATLKRTYFPAVDSSLLASNKKFISAKNGYVTFNRGDKLGYFFGIFGKHWPGFFLTALAISLGAPFWFDLLNKLMKLRTSVKQPSTSTNTNKDNTVHPSNSN